MSAGLVMMATLLISIALKMPLGTVALDFYVTGEEGREKRVVIMSQIQDREDTLRQVVLYCLSLESWMRREEPSGSSSCLRPLLNTVWLELRENF